MRTIKLEVSVVAENGKEEAEAREQAPREGETGGMQTTGRSMKCTPREYDDTTWGDESWKESRLI